MSDAVLLMAYGGPTSLEEVEPFLLDVRGGRKTSPEKVEEVRQRYARIGGCSPLLEITQAQAAALQAHLDRRAPGRFRVFVGMRHWAPTILEAVQQIDREGLRQGVAICMTPIYSKMSVGAYFERLDEAESGVQSGLRLKRVGSWHTQPLFIQALARHAAEALERFPAEQRDEVVALFSAHSLPAAIVQHGDPYVDQIDEMATQIGDALGLPESRRRVCFQSGGTHGGHWLGPSVEETIQTLAAGGVKNVLVSPVGFAADHVEILYDLDIEAQEVAQACGVRLERAASMNADPGFIEALAETVLLEAGS